MFSENFLKKIEEIKGNNPELTSLSFYDKDFDGNSEAEALKILVESLESNIWIGSYEFKVKDKNNENYRRFHELLSRNRDIVKATADCVRSTFGARLLREINKEFAGVKVKINADQLDNILFSFAKKFFLSRLSVEEIVLFSEHWHKTITQIDIRRLKDYNEITWPTLFQQKEFPILQQIAGKEGWKIVERTSPEELKLEGKILGHCTDGYTGKCLTEGHRIFSIVDENNKPDYTFEILIDFWDKSIKLSEMMEGRNSSKHAAEIIENFVEQIRSGNAIFTVDYSSLERFQVESIASGANQLAGEAIFYLGFNPLDAQKFKEVLKAYRNEAIPKELKPKFVEFLQINEIDFGNIQHDNLKLSGRKISLEPLVSTSKPTDAAEIEARTVVNSEKQNALLREIQDCFDGAFSANLAVCSIEKGFGGKEYGLVMVRPIDEKNADLIVKGLNEIQLFKGKIKIDEATGGILIDDIAPRPAKTILSAARDSSRVAGLRVGQVTPLKIATDQIEHE